MDFSAFSLIYSHLEESILVSPLRSAWFENLCSLPVIAKNQFQQRKVEERITDTRNKSSLLFQGLIKRQVLHDKKYSTALSILPRFVGSFVEFDIESPSKSFNAGAKNSEYL